MGASRLGLMAASRLGWDVRGGPARPSTIFHYSLPPPRRSHGLAASRVGESGRSSADLDLVHLLDVAPVHGAVAEFRGFAPAIPLGFGEGLFHLLFGDAVEGNHAAVGHEEPGALAGAVAEHALDGGAVLAHR